MTIKKYGLIALLMVSVTCIVHAQHHRGILEHNEDLGLSPEQEEAIWEVQYENRKSKKSKKVEINKSGRVDLKAQAVEFQSAIDTILTEEQRKKWREIQAFNTEDRRVAKEELKEEMEEFRERRLSYIERSIKPVVKKHRLGFDQLLNNTEKSSIEAVREKRMQAKAGPPSKGNHDRLKENHKSIAKIIFDHKDELDQIWSELDEELMVWNKELESMKSEIGEDLAKNRKHHAKNRKGNRRKAEFSRLDFILIDY